MLMSERISFASEAYIHAKSLWSGKRYSAMAARRRKVDGTSIPYAKGRDPKSIAAVLETMTKDMGWGEQLSQTTLIVEWPTLVGKDIAEHTEVVGITGKKLEIQCDSTAWATQLRRMRHQIVTKLLEQYPEAGIEDILFRGPHTPSWRHGPRSVPGRGPRDTYG
ncbi:DUF721 domain-containing protein [Leucobacter sp. UCMA 4100]|nr:DUF721 domain-containing protein [Leucobacter sp. UCMA 4100]